MSVAVRQHMDLEALNDEFEHRHALVIIAWGVETFGDDIALSSSFGADSAVMLHLATQVKPDIKVVTVNTGFLFQQTLDFQEQLRQRLGLNICEYKPALSREQFLAHHGKMWRSAPDSCCGMNKREPFDRAKRELGLRSWMTGVRREQSNTRRNTAIVSRDHEGLLKLCPIATWTAKDVHYYLLENDLPYHPLRAAGFLSIGCEPEEGFCTRRVNPGDDPRAGRWAGFDKTECGLHVHDQGSGI